MNGPPKDGLGGTIVAGTSVGTILGGATLVALLLASGLSFGSCMSLAPPTGAPARDGLGIATTSDGRRVLVVDSNAGLLDVLTDDRLTSQIEVGGQTTDVVLSPDGRFAYVTDSEVGSSTGYLAVVDLTSDKVTARIPVGSGPTGVAASPDGRTVYVADTGYIGNGNIAIVDPRLGRVVDSITVGRQPIGLAVSADGSRLYVALANLYLDLAPPHPTQPGDVDVVDITTRAVVATIPVGIAPLFAALSPDGRSLATGNYGSNSVTVMNTSTLETRTFAVAGGAFGIAFGAAGARLYVSGGHSPLIDSAPGIERLDNHVSDTVSVVNVATGAVTMSVHVPGDPTGIAVAPDGTVVVAEGAVPAVVRIDPSTLGTVVAGAPGLAPPTQNAGPP